VDGYAIHILIQGYTGSMGCDYADSHPLFGEMSGLFEDKAAGKIAFSEREGCGEEAYFHGCLIVRQGWVDTAIIFLECFNG
jgi:hypothetical protein